MLKRVFAALSLVVIAGCTGPADPHWSPDDMVERMRYAAPGPSSLTLVTMKNTGNNSGAHSGLIISAPSERIIFDPAGSFEHPMIPERNDVLHGVNPNVLSVYLDFHSRQEYYTVTQTIQISDASAERIKRAAQDYGAVPKARCTRSISDILATIPETQGLNGTFFPNNMWRQWAKLPGVETNEFRDDDPDKKVALARWDAVLRAQ